MLKVLTSTPSLLSRFIEELRCVNIQRDSMRFRRNMERIGEIMAYEISQSLGYESKLVETPLGELQVDSCSDEVVVATILRAGVPFHQGFMNYFDSSSAAFVAAYRKSHKDNTFEVKLDYVSCGDIEGKVLLLVDPMLATGASLEIAYKALCERGGEPKQVHIASILASEQGIDFIKGAMDSSKTTLWVGAVDQELTSKCYIVPGLGDAGDLAYGSKM
ncbi:MAG: uracil phosphoribosyltransferase [Rikenellaceae bacterium]